MPWHPKWKKIGRIANVAALRTQCRSIQKNSKKRSLGRIVNDVAFITQCHSMRGQLKIHVEDKIANVAALNLGCRCIGPEVEKKNSLIFIKLLVYVGF